MEEFKAYLLFTRGGMELILTKYDFIKNPELLSKLAARTSNKFIAHGVSIDTVRTNYGGHFDNVLNDPNQADDIKILDDDGMKIFTNVSFKDLLTPVYYEPEQSESGQFTSVST